MGSGVDAARHPRKLASALSRSEAMAETVVRDEVIGAPQTSLNEAIGGTRRLAAVRSAARGPEAIKRELGGTVNDVVLAATAGGLRRLFEHRGEGADVDTVAGDGPGQPPRGERALALGNRVSSLFVDLPVARARPAASLPQDRRRPPRS